VNEKIGELLVKQNLLSSDQLRSARDEARNRGERVGAQITKLGYLQEAELTDFVSR
jgi:type IV pilus assembly protein PilB